MVDFGSSSTMYMNHLLRASRPSFLMSQEVLFEVRSKSTVLYAVDEWANRPRDDICCCSVWLHMLPYRAAAGSHAG